MRRGTDHKFHPKEESTELLESEIVFRRSLYYATTTNHKPSRQIYDTLIIMHPELADVLPFKKIERTMARWRKRTVFPKFESYSELVEELGNEQWQFLKCFSADIYDEREFSIQVKNDNKMMIIYSEDIINGLNIENLYVSTTTKVLPDFDNSKFLTVVIAEMNQHAFPIVWFLTKDYSSITNGEIGKSLKEILPNLRDGTIIYADSTSKMTTGLGAKFLQVQGSFENLCNMLRSIAHEHNVNEDDGDVNLTLRKLMTIILLPEDKIAIQFNAIADNMNENTKELLSNFFENYKVNWIDSYDPLASFGTETSHY
ncbi:uncharacterized protein LOC123267872 [Cotesia glomerata]|uniref:uncharacterized protein LOC123267872 n=1 Tax=Cotesia glomerata TaxID=32391 RepID=UPI001D01AB92|nr:uncharacterized protein LOC123267872 [Cotesia glomerata]